MSSKKFLFSFQNLYLLVWSEFDENTSLVSLTWLGTFYYYVKKITLDYYFTMDILSLKFAHMKTLGPDLVIRSC